MAFDLATRFPSNYKCNRIFDPGAYDKGGYVCAQNKAPFLSKSPRVTQPGGKHWTQAIYDADKCHKIPNVTSITSKTPRFPYEAFKIEEFEAKLCECGIAPCDCPTNNQDEEAICQAKVPRRLFKGPVPQSVIGGGLSVPSRKHRGYEVFPDGTKNKLEVEISEGPPIYDTRLTEFTDFYRGCKWSHWTSKRTTSFLEKRPGPADYNLEAVPITDKICVEMLRADRRRTSRQPRFIEIIQHLNVKENRPGPAHYSPGSAKGTDMQYLGTKAQRFTDVTETRPGPADHFIRRSFDLPTKPKHRCHARLPLPAPFGVKAERVTMRLRDGPSPDMYDPRINFCKFLKCSKVPFGSTAKRFKDTKHEEIDSDDEYEVINENNRKVLCPETTWEFKSKTNRFDPLVLRKDEPSPADLAMSTFTVDRPKSLQYQAPFLSSEGRFRPWRNEIPVFGSVKTSGPGAFNLERPKCSPAVHHGPLYRAQRFPKPTFSTPAPNEYMVGGGVETVLRTCNKKLEYNLNKQHKFKWQPPPVKPTLSAQEREEILLNKTIALLDVDSSTENKPVRKSYREKTKLLRYFLYKHQVKKYF